MERREEKFFEGSEKRSSLQKILRVSKSGNQLLQIGFIVVRTSQYQNGFAKLLTCTWQPEFKLEAHKSFP